MYNIIKTKNIWFAVSALLVVLSIAALIIWGLRLGIDFQGGSIIQVKFSENTPSSQEVVELLNELEIGEIIAQPAGDNQMVLRFGHVDNETRQSILDKLNESYGQVEEELFESIGPTIGQETKNKAISAIIIVCVAIIAYISIAFRKVSAGSVPSWVYGLGAIIAVVHDVLIITGMYAVLGHYLNVEIGALFITALLTIMGFSVHDTIVVYDRIREGLKTSTRESFSEIVNESINGTIVRSLNTSITTLFVLLTLYLFGGETIKYFVLALIAGVIIGTYSSIFIASPLLLVWQRIRK